MARSANDQLGGTTERRYRKKILKMQNYYMTVAMAVIKRCAASGRPLQAESAASGIQHVKYNCDKLCKIKANICTKDDLR